MKIGVALSGCDIGGVCAAEVLAWLKREGVGADFISASGAPAVPAVLYACGMENPQRAQYLDVFLAERAETDLDSAIANLSAHLHPRRLQQVRGLALGSLNLSDGRVICFTNDFVFATDTLLTFPLGEPYDAMSAAVGAVDGLCNYPYQGHKLCDYCVQYGCPIFPLHLTGCEKILSFSFVPEIPRSPYDILITRRILDTAHDADLHLDFTFCQEDLQDASQERYQEVAISKLEACRNDILTACAFS